MTSLHVAQYSDAPTAEYSISDFRFGATFDNLTKRRVGLIRTALWSLDSAIGWAFRTEQTLNLKIIYSPADFVNVHLKLLSPEAFFSPKYTKYRNISFGVAAGLRPHQLAGELTALPRPPSWIKGAYF